MKKIISAGIDWMIGRYFECLANRIANTNDPVLRDQRITEWVESGNFFENNYCDLEAVL